MRRSKKALLAAGLLAGAAAMTGCSAKTTVSATPTPAANEQATAEPQTAQPDAATEPAQDADTGETPIPLRVDGREADVDALAEDSMLLLPIVETARLLGWEAEQEDAQDGTQTRASIGLEREGSRISITWAVSDNTIRQITWQKDGLLIPVDAMLTSVSDVVYAPAAFFETAMDVKVSRVEDRVEVEPPEPRQTPPMAQEPQA